MSLEDLVVGEREREREREKRRGDVKGRQKSL
jgi:hypothetical protein